MRYILISDLDGTLTGDKEGIALFNKTMCSNKEKFYLIYSSGRFKESILSVIEKEKLILPNAIISNVGTEIYYSPHWSEDEEWKKIIGKNWDKEKISSFLDKFDIKLQPHKKRFVVSCYIENEIMVEKIKEMLENHGVKVIYTKKLCLDITPECGGKDNAAEYIRNKMNLPLICCGDSENDEEMLKVSDCGILVGNATTNLKRKLSKYFNIYIAKSCYAKGIIEGLKFYSFID
jgi:sucrose-6F-phosphate phosphohydrolase